MFSKGKNKYAVLILAAGSSSRLGKPKQLVKIGDITLLNRTISKAFESFHDGVYIVLGNDKEKIIPTLSSNVFLIINDNWKMGMGKSIATGINELKNKNFDGVVIALSDQLHLESTNINNLIDAHTAKKKGIVLSKYTNGQGPPSLFDKKYFEELSYLCDDTGAKTIVKKYYTDVSFVPFENGHVDIDVPEDLKLLNEQ